MMRGVRLVRAGAGVIAAAAAAYLTAQLSAAPVALHHRDEAMLRLSWSARPERIEVCRTLSAEELATRPEHMRQRVECVGRFATYQLRVESDGRSLTDTVVRGAGLRNDRPIYLLSQFVIEPGERRIRVLFQRRETIDTTVARSRRPERKEDDHDDDDTGTFAGRAQREVVERDRRARAAIPPLLVLDTTVTLTAGRVLLVTMDRGRRTLTLLDRPPR